MLRAQNLGFGPLNIPDPTTVLGLGGPCVGNMPHMNPHPQPGRFHLSQPVRFGDSYKVVLVGAGVTIKTTKA